MFFGCDFMRHGVTVEFDDRYYDVLENWSKLGYQSSIPVLVEWLVAQAVDERQINVPVEAKNPTMGDFDTLGNLCLHFWDKLQRQPGIDKDELALVGDGKKADEVMLLRIAIATGYPIQYLELLNRDIDRN